jgi:hypothetical protein
MRGRWQGNCLWAVAMLVLSIGCHGASSYSVQRTNTSSNAMVTVYTGAGTL